MIAQIKGIDPEKASEVVFENTCRLYGVVLVNQFKMPKVN